MQVKPQTLSNLLFAFAALDCHPGEVFLASLGLAIERQAQLFKPQELAASLWGFAMLRHHPGPGLVNVGLTETRRCVWQLLQWISHGRNALCHDGCQRNAARQCNLTALTFSSMQSAGNWTSSSCRT